MRIFGLPAVMLALIMLGLPQSAMAKEKADLPEAFRELVATYGEAIASGPSCPLFNDDEENGLGYALGHDLGHNLGNDLAQKNGKENLGYGLVIDQGGFPFFLVARKRGKDLLVYGLWTVRNGKPFRLLVSTARSSVLAYQHLDGRVIIYREGSQHASFFYRTYWQLKHGELVPLVDAVFDKVGYPQDPWQLNGRASTENDAQKALAAIRNQCRPLDLKLIPIGNDHQAGHDQAELNAMLAKDAQFKVSDHFVASPNKPGVDIVFASRTGLANFRVLALAFNGIGNDGKPVFAATTLYRQATLAPERPLLVTVQFLGSIPNNGIAYEDASGNIRNFALEQSGEDGSILLTPITVAR